MKITGQISVPAPRNRVFEALRDARFFAACVDGVRDLTEVDQTHYRALLETKIAYMSFRFNVAVELTRIEPPALIEARIEGTPIGIVGRLTATSTTRLTACGEATLVDYAIESTLSGKLGSIGQPVLNAKARDMEREFTTRICAAFAQEAAGEIAMKAFELEAPDSLRAAVERLDRENPSVRVIAGGTALMLLMKAGVFRPSRLISLHAIEARFSSIDLMPDGNLRIGAMTTLAEMERSDDLRRFAPVIRRTLRTLSNVRVRNVATIGGHLAHADPHLDLPPVLIALGANVLVIGRGGERRIPVQDLYSGYYETVLARDELISEVVIPAQQQRRSTYVKCSTRAAHDWPAVGIAVSLEVANNVALNPRIVVGAATERPLRATAAEDVLSGRPINAETLRRTGAAAANTIESVSDARGSASYKTQLVGIYVERALLAATGNGFGAAAPMSTRAIPSGQVGRSLPRLEAHEKVTGRTEYVHNLRLPGMLYGKIFRSTVAHGRIRAST